MPVTVKGTKKARGQSEAALHLCTHVHRWMPVSQLSSSTQNPDFLLLLRTASKICLFGFLTSDGFA